MRHFIMVSVLAFLASCSQKNSNTEVLQASMANASVISSVEKTEFAKKESTRSTDPAKAIRISVMPDFTKYTDVKEKKQAFFDFLRPMVAEENERLTEERAKLLAIYDDYAKTGNVSSSDQEWLKKEASRLKENTFDISNADARLALQKKIDIVPAAMFLAQAANESAWGTSRFAKEANNLFGQWCFTKGCGIVPSQRGANEKHEVQKFATVNDAVRSYVNNINSHNAYRKLRELRNTQRVNGITPTGIECAGGLEKYSARGMEYVKEIRAMIRINKLEAII